jgi:hypothetical protein
LFLEKHPLIPGLIGTNELDIPYLPSEQLTLAHGPSLQECICHWCDHTTKFAHREAKLLYIIMKIKIASLLPLSGTFQ